MQGTVLIVDSDAGVRTLLTGNLTLAGYRIACAASLAEAEEVVRRTRPDVALLEWNGLTPGLMFVRQMRCRRRTSDMASHRRERTSGGAGTHHRVGKRCG